MSVLGQFLVFGWSLLDRLWIPALVGCPDGVQGGEKQELAPALQVKLLLRTFQDLGIVDDVDILYSQAGSGLLLPEVERHMFLLSETKDIVT